MSENDQNEGKNKKKIVGYILQNSQPVKFYSFIKLLIADGGYRGQLAGNIRNTFGYVLQVIISGYKNQGFRPIKGRWVIVRSFAWFDNDRRLCRNYEVSFDAAEQIVKISAIKLLLNKI